MNNVISISVNGTSWNDRVQRYGFIETPEKILGKNHSENGALDGTTIVDYIRTKYHPTWLLMPMTASQLAAVASTLASGSVTLAYFSPSKNQTRTISAQPDLSEIELALKSATKEIYSDIRITFKEI